MRLKIVVACLISMFALLRFVARTDSNGNPDRQGFGSHWGCHSATRVLVAEKYKNLARAALSNSGTIFRVSNLQPGRYQVGAERTGFQRAIISGLDLLVDQTAHIDIKMKLSKGAQSVVVKSAPPVVTAKANVVSNVIDIHEMQDIPLIRFRLQFRADSFKVSNHLNFGQPGARVGIWS